MSVSVGIDRKALRSISGAGVVVVGLLGAMVTGNVAQAPNEVELAAYSGMAAQGVDPNCRELSNGYRGDCARQLQSQIGAKPDGDFGSETEGKVREYQKAHGLKEDGIVGPDTKEALGVKRSQPKPPLELPANPVNSPKENPVTSPKENSSSKKPHPGWCPFGTHHGKGTGCRGGSINDNKRLNESLKDTGQMYKDAGECAGAGLAGGVSSQLRSPVPSFQGLAANSVPGAIACGASKPQGK